MAITRKPAPRTKWTPARELRFLEHLAMSSNVRAAERVAAVPQGSAYYRRNRVPAFRASWDQALREGYSRLEVALLDRAINGTPVTVFDKQGKRRITREYSERLALNLLSQHRAAVAATGAIDADESAKERLARKLEEMAQRLDADAATGDATGAGDDA